jgi:DNA-binding PadR family transcriptional regulator
MNGYQIIQEIGERGGGLWRPSPGSVYPALQQLQHEGLIQAEPGATGHCGYVLTDSGFPHQQDHRVPGAHQERHDSAFARAACARASRRGTGGSTVAAGMAWDDWRSHR